jgi:hypothetical protein
VAKLGPLWWQTDRGAVEALLTKVVNGGLSVLPIFVSSLPPLLA